MICFGYQNQLICLIYKIYDNNQKDQQAEKQFDGFPEIIVNYCFQCWTVSGKVK